MDIHFFCPLWGSESLSFSDFCSRVQKAGYTGVELSFPVGETKLRANRLAILADFGLLYIAQHWETTEPNLARHQDEYRRRLDFLAEAKPLFINSQTGRDWFTLDDNLSILSIADRVSADTVDSGHDKLFTITDVGGGYYKILLKAAPTRFWRTEDIHNGNGIQGRDWATEGNYLFEFVAR